MNDFETFRRFEYRPSRHRADFAVEFTAGGKTVHGFCRNVSEEGVCAEFDGSVVVGSSGLLILRRPGGILRLNAEVAYLDKKQVGLSFVLKTTTEHLTFIEFIAP